MPPTNEPSGQGMRLRLQLADLARRYAVQADAAIIKLSPPTDDPITVLTGIASNSNIDLDRTTFAAGSLFWNQMPSLHLKHDTDRPPIGTIESLRYNSKGELLIEAHITDREAARYNAFSIGARVIDYVLKDTSSPGQYHAVIQRAELTEISVTDIPSNATCLVAKKYPYKTPAVVEFYDLVIRKLAVLQKLVAELTKVASTPPPSYHPRDVSSNPFEASPGHVYGPIPRKPTSFGSMVQQLSERTQ